MAQFTYARLDRVMRKAGFERIILDPEARRYSHPLSGAAITLPEMPGTDAVLPRHLMAVHVVLGNFGHQDPPELERALRGLRVG